MSKTIQKLFFILALLMPIQNVLAQIIVNKLGLPEFFVLWKEMVILIIDGYFLLEIAKKIRQKWLTNENKTKFWQTIFGQSYLLVILLIANFLIFLNSFVFNETNWKVFVIGYRFELWWLGFFVITVTWWKMCVDYERKWLDNFYKNLVKYILLGFSFTVFISLATLFFGSQILDNIGFGSQNSSLISQTTNCNPIDYGYNTCRLGGGFASPNHFAGYLLLVLPILVTLGYSAWQTQQNRAKFSFLWLSVVNLILILLTVSRFAWLALSTFLLSLIVFYVYQFTRKTLAKNLGLVFNLVFILILIFPVFTGIFVINSDPEKWPSYIPTALAKPSSTIEHRRQTMATVEVLQSDGRILVRGLGLGSSGSAAKEEYQDMTKNPMIKNYLPIALKWGLVDNRLPIPENWFLQTLVNGGLLYALLYLIMCISPLFGFFKRIIVSGISTLKLTDIVFLFGFFSILIGNLFLHIWENQTITIYWTILWIYKEIHQQKPYFKSFQK